ncbi:hypothetical protein ABMB67_003886 [Halalkalibacter oceani]
MTFRGDQDLYATLAKGFNPTNSIVLDGSGLIRMRVQRSGFSAPALYGEDNRHIGTIVLKAYRFEFGGISSVQ